MFGVQRYHRSVSGQLISYINADIPFARIEMLKRSCGEVAEWSFRQPKLCLIWYSRGKGDYDLVVDGASVRGSISEDTPLSLFPAESDIKGKFIFNGVCEYTIVFLDPVFAEQNLGIQINRAVVGFSNSGLIDGFRDLRREAQNKDDAFPLYAMGWAYQAMAHLSRIPGIKSAGIGAGIARGGLSGRLLRRLDEYICEHISAPLTLTDLAKVVDLSVRQFLRAFRESRGMSPHQYLLAVRIREAKSMLSSTEESITQIALACGFSHSQHFSTIFKKIQGQTPSEFRRSSPAYDCLV